MLSVVMLNVVMLSVVMLSVVMLNVVILSVIMLNVVMLSVIILIFLAPRVGGAILAFFDLETFWATFLKIGHFFPKKLWVTLVKPFLKLL
jgi:hypothetical protein